MNPQLLLSYDFPPMGGGIARWMGELAKRYPPGSLVVSTGSHPGGSKVDATLRNRVDRIPTSSRRLRTLQGLVAWSRRAAALARSVRPEFVWCGNFKPAGYPARWIRHRVGTPYGIMFHGTDLLLLRSRIQVSEIKPRIARMLIGGAAGLVANSGYTRSLCLSVLDELGFDSRTMDVRVLPLGTDPEHFRPGIDQSGARAQYGLNGRRWLLSVARLTGHKGIDTGIRVLAMLGERYPELGYAVVGTGGDLARLESLTRELGIAHRVRFLAGVPDSDLPAVYNAAVAYLGLSRLKPAQVEGFGISLVEAAACGLPTVAGRAGGIPDAVRDGETGLLVDPENLEEICRAVRRLLDDPEQAARMGQAGRRAVESYYNWDRVAADLHRIGQELGQPLNREVVPHD
jgi:phosphatidylinositol alpha-1,6-mannosyltransferase